VNGFQDSGLFKVTTGTSVRVTPLIVDDGAGRGVMMSIDIEDGNISASNAVDSIPVVLHRTVSTQALIDEGTSLLIAGYSSEEKTNATTGVPILASIPVLGNLFKYREDKANKQERFYLLTPRLVVPDAPGMRPPAPAPRQVPQLSPQKEPLPRVEPQTERSGAAAPPRAIGGVGER
jgi:type III secretion protein C